jgi:uncharacterized protein YbjT (DUF2867 family)
VTPLGERKSAAVVGATGLVGRECLSLLASASAFARVTALVRRSHADDAQHAKLRTVVVDFDRLEAQAEYFGVTHVFCALGTTIKQAGSEARFRQIDFGYTVRVMEVARAAGVRHFLFVSSVGADPKARALYLRVKGELEVAIRAAGFPSVTIVRPSVLRGARREFRVAERFAASMSWALPATYRAVDVVDVAKVLVAAATEDRPGLRVIENADIPRLAKEV